MKNSRQHFVRFHGECVGEHNPWRMNSTLFPFYMVEGNLIAINQYEPEKNQNTSNYFRDNEDVLADFFRPIPWCFKIDLARQLEAAALWFSDSKLGHKDWKIQQLALTKNASMKIVDLTMTHHPEAGQEPWHEYFLLQKMFDEDVWDCKQGNFTLTDEICGALRDNLHSWAENWTVSPPLDTVLNTTAAIDVDSCLTANAPYIKSLLSRRYQQDLDKSQQRCSKSPAFDCSTCDRDFRPC